MARHLRVRPTSQPQRDDLTACLPRERVADAEEPALGVFPQDELIGTAVAYSDGGREVHEQHEAAQESAHRARAD